MSSAAAVPFTFGALGGIAQLAFVPSNFDAALRYWTEGMGVGPFYQLQHLQLGKLSYQGSAITVDISVALSYWGDIQIELIQQHDRQASIYRDWCSDTLHHVQILVPDFGAAVAAGERAGYSIAMEGRGSGASPDVRFAYFHLGEGAPMGFVEIVHYPGGQPEWQKRIHEEARNWDGRDAVRVL